MEYPNNYIATSGLNRWVGGVCSIDWGCIRSIERYARSIEWAARSLLGIHAISKNLAILKKTDLFTIMYSTHNHQQVIEEIAKLSDPQIQILLDFIKTLQMKEDSRDFDPLADFVGAVDEGNLAQHIDQTLYE